MAFLQAVVLVAGVVEVEDLLFFTMLEVVLLLFLGVEFLIENLNVSINLLIVISSFSSFPELLSFKFLIVCKH